MSIVQTSFLGVEIVDDGEVGRKKTKKGSETRTMFNNENDDLCLS